MGVGLFSFILDVSQLDGCVSEVFSLLGELFGGERLGVGNFLDVVAVVFKELLPLLFGVFLA